MTRFGDIIKDRKVVVCCGTGGVGKTTTAAATALAAALDGRSAVVVTIDPARRLANALGIDELGNTPKVIDGPWPGRLGALMLDTKSTFDEVVKRNAADDRQAKRILSNRFYRNISTTLSGTQDYMAVEKLSELYESSDWDLVVVDTPPTRDALAFLDAPLLLTRLLDNPIYRMLTAPSRGMLRVVNSAAQTMLRRLARVVGADVVDEAVAFFQSFEGMEDGFRSRAMATLDLLADDRTAFVLVASPRRDTLDEARFFLRQLHDSGLGVAAVVVNRVLPAMSTSPGRSAAIAHTRLDRYLNAAAAALADHTSAAEGDEHRIEDLMADIDGATLVKVPLLPTDVHDINGLSRIAALLIGGSGGVLVE